ncbi:MAG: thioesterase domain-containing protein, partial [Acidobacteriota bacterium]
SLLAVRLIAKIKNLLGRHIPLATLFQEATIERLAVFLRQQVDPLPSSVLVKIQPRGLKPPFFCVHPAGGTTFCYIDLARHLGSDQPFFGLQAIGVDGQQQPLSTVEEMATGYITELRKAQPLGPYFLGGWSTGGVVAFEMAQQLNKQGEKVALLALFDCIVPVPLADDGTSPDTAFLIMISEENDIPISVEELRRLSSDEQINYFLEQAKSCHFIPADTDLDQASSFLKLYRSNFQAVHNYKPQVYPNRITLFRAREMAKDCSEHPYAYLLQDPTRGWSKFSSLPIEIEVVSGTHPTMVYEPHVQELADKLRQALSKSQM